MNIEDIAGTWAIDPSHSDVGFSVRHMMISKVRGSFGAVSGTIVTDGNPADTKIDVSIDVTSVDTRDENRDNHLRSGDFFDVATFPTMAFKSTSVKELKKEDVYEVEGDLTIKDVTRPVTLKVEFGGVNTDPYGNTKGAASISTSIKRTDFGLTWNVALETGGVLVSDEVKIEIDLQAALQK
jgi:polyisoprenoid-binding protein YceI